MIGLTLGWLAAGLAPSLKPALGQEAAPATEQAGAQSQEVQATEPAGETHAAPAADHDHAAAEHGEHSEHEEAGFNAARELIPSDPAHDIAWYRPVLMAAVGLFAAAIVLGIPALKLRGPLPPDPADTHDDHAHDDAHGGDSHAAHGHH